ncbi:ABC transporter ATP-binding protein [Falsibacillus pallidus]|uniref:Quaternary amine transport ATP-binding protein n=1 Tax=Falsibacillus pallidus TaxID=493781 RepID=A0A370GR15_9BACI|nr:ABC transporter ATP-binding protein [Falsibacillus pallidus]RDI45849.1 osmoprotectant transport system ATP-binding protein [Falsibacillus pallidus]
MISFKGVEKTFKDGTTAVDGLDLDIQEGEFAALIGPSGCGKTTTMKMINKLIEPTSGEIYINGENIAAKDPVELRRNIGYVIQQIGLFPHMTIEQNVALIPRLKGWKKEKYVKRVDELLDMVGLDPVQFKRKYPLELSGGQQQRVGVIRALAAEPPIILMDEPFSALDPISREQLQDELKNLQKQIKKTIVFVTHDIDEALKLADRIALMKEGKIVQYDTPAQLVAKPANLFAEQFIGEERLKNARAAAGPPEYNLLDYCMTGLPVLSLEKDFTTKLEPWPEDMPAGIHEIHVVDENHSYAGTVFKEEMESQPLTLNLLHHSDTFALHTNTIKEAARMLFSTNRTSVPVAANGHYAGLVTKDRLFAAMAGLKEESTV